jgi:acyl-homoserine lactone acylase PvdQ
MNPQAYKLLYVASRNATSDLMDLGRAELADELLLEHQKFVEDWLPNYSTSRSISTINDLTKILDSEEEEGSSAEALLNGLLNGDRSKAIDWLCETEAAIYAAALENFKQNQ